MAFIGVDVNEQRILTSDLDPGEPKTEFVCKILTNRKKIAMMNDLTGVDEKDSLAITGNSVDIFLSSVVEIRNYKNSKGELQTISVITEDVVNSLPVGVVLEIASAIIYGSFATKEEVKN